MIKHTGRKSSKMLTFFGCLGKLDIKSLVENCICFIEVNVLWKELFAVFKGIKVMGN